MTEKEAEVERGGGGVRFLVVAGRRRRVVEMGKWPASATLDIIGSSGSSNELCVLLSVSINGISYSEENSSPELADSYYIIFGMGSLSRIMVILSVIFPSHFVQSLRLKRTRNIAHALSTIRRVTTQIIDAEKSTLATPRKTPNLKKIQSVMLGSLVWRLNNDLTSRGARKHRYADDLGHTLPIPTGESTHPIRPPFRNTSRILLQPADGHHIRPDPRPKVSLKRRGGASPVFSRWCDPACGGRRYDGPHAEGDIHRALPAPCSIKLIHHPFIPEKTQRFAQPRK